MTLTTESVSAIQKDKICIDCKLSKSIDNFYTAYRYKSKIQYQSRCKNCCNKKSILWAKNNPDKRKKILRKHLFGIKYNISEEEFNNLKFEQNNKCAICKETQRNPKDELCIDHDHTTGKVRGLLCHRCNIGLGFLKDNENLIEKLLSYLRKNKC